MTDNAFEVGSSGRTLDIPHAARQEITGNKAGEVDGSSDIEGSVGRPVMADLGKASLTELAPEEKEELTEKWGEQIASAVGSVEEAKIYEKAGLERETVAGREVLVKTDIDLDQIDPGRGWTNLERMERGWPPLDKNGKPIELHHIGQKNDGPFAELTDAEHRKNGNFSVLHPRQDGSEIDRPYFGNVIKPGHWRARAEQLKTGEAQ